MSHRKTAPQQLDGDEIAEVASVLLSAFTRRQNEGIANKSVRVERSGETLLLKLRS